MKLTSLKCFLDFFHLLSNSMECENVKLNSNKTTFPSKTSNLMVGNIHFSLTQNLFNKAGTNIIGM